MTLAAARSIVFETSFSAQNSTLSPAEWEAAENLVAEAIADSAGEHPAAIASIARNLYWKLNPMGTVPPSFYQDANFLKLTDRLLGVVNPQACSKPLTSNDRPAIEEEGSEALGDYFPTPAAQSIAPYKDAKRSDSSVDLMFGDVAKEGVSLKDAPKGTGPFSPETLNAIRAILANFVEDLSEVVTVKAEWQGREHEVMSTPTRIASERLALIMSNVSAVPRTASSDVNASPVPLDWATEVVSWIYQSVQKGSPIKWLVDEEQKEQVIRDVAVQLPDLIEDFARTAAFQDNFGNTVTLSDAPGWTRAAAVSVYDFVVDGLAQDTMSVGRAALIEGVNYLQRSMFENVYPALILGMLSPSVSCGLPIEDVAQKPSREAWKMPWSVARDIVEDLCSRAQDERAFLDMFKGWLGSPNASMDEVRNELVSEIVARGREKEVVGEVDIADQPSVSFVYENWKGEIAVRTAVPVRMIFASNEWHKEKQWLIEAFDLKHNAMRTFAVSGILKFLGAEK
ncbi:WYL domain-containing protein [Agrobacterium rubi]|nr:WYL domain-containing protein [Agrobacterium rubi]NTF24707.1 WYL domain-containing protein [Agrobacterium rubi]